MNLAPCCPRPEQLRSRPLSSTTGSLGNKDGMHSYQGDKSPRYLYSIQYESCFPRFRSLTFASEKHGVVKITQIDQNCSARIDPSRSEQDLLFVPTGALRESEISSCGDFAAVSFSSLPVIAPMCRQYRLNASGIAYSWIWDSANSFVRQASLYTGGSLLRQYTFLSQLPLTSPFPPTTFEAPSSCSGFVFCPQYAARLFLRVAEMLSGLLLLALRLMAVSQLVPLTFGQRNSSLQR